MAGEQPLVTHALECRIQRVLANALLQVATVGQQVALCRFDLRQQVANNLDGLER
ncbi:hypothetical protein D3C80_2203700 [compost metagenome]